MRHAVALLLLALAAPVAAQDQPQEDAAHREDRLRTQALNSRSFNGYAPAPDDQRGYDAAREEYRRRLDDWRRRVAACEAGYYGACQR